MDTIDVLADLSTREMQVFGAYCLRSFCHAKGISHPDIDALISHLLAVLVAERLDVWERRGAALALSGRGDPFSPLLRDQVPPQDMGDLTRMVDTVVEIGIIDMYTQPSKRPLHNLYKCLAILDKNMIERPTVDELFDGRRAHGRDGPEWGEIYSRERFWHVQSRFR